MRDFSVFKEENQMRSFHRSRWPDLSNLCEDLFNKRVSTETSSETFPGTNRKVIRLLILGVVMGSYEELDRSIETMYFKTPAGGYQCSECGYSSTVTTNIVNHIESKHLETPGIDCDLCNKHLRTRQAYRMHVHRVHGSQPTKFH